MKLVPTKIRMPVKTWTGSLYSVMRTARDLPRTRTVSWQRMLTRSPVGQRAIGFANGAFGERADPRGNVLPARMSVRLDHGRIELDARSLAAAYPTATGRLVVFLHRLVETERSWFHRARFGKHRSDTDFGSQLAADLSYSPVYLRYNTGRHISDNGSELVALLCDLVETWPVPATQIVLIGHSMGGLVARSALPSKGRPQSVLVRGKR